MGKAGFDRGSPALEADARPLSYRGGHSPMVLQVVTNDHTLESITTATQTTINTEQAVPSSRSVMALGLFV